MFRDTILLRVVGVVLLSTLSLSGLAAEDPWFLLEKTAYAARELNYQGVFVYQNGKQTRSVQITHMNSNGQEMTRNVVLDNSVSSGQTGQADQLREVYSQGSNIVILHSQNQKEKELL